MNPWPCGHFGDLRRACLPCYMAISAGIGIGSGIQVGAKAKLEIITCMGQVKDLVIEGNSIVECDLPTRLS